MAKKRSSTKKSNTDSRRTTIVWASFVAAMTVVGGLLVVSDGSLRAGFVAASPGFVAEAPTTRQDPITQTQAPIQPGKWTGILIHASGEPAGDADTLHRKHLAAGMRGLGYHFVIGNGNGLGDGIVQVGYRWNQQLDGAHAAIGADQHNLHSIGICLIGNGDRRPFTDRQMRQLVNLVQRLQRELDIPASAVRLHREVAPGVSSPGTFFASSQFRDQLLP